MGDITVASKPLTFLAAGLALLATLAPARADDAAATAPSEPMTILDGVFTQEQADRGKIAYDAHCASCHSGNLRGTWNMGPSIAGFRFNHSWNDQSVGDLFAYLKASMPKVDPGTLTDRQYADIVAYLLLRNEYPAGTTLEIPLDPDAQSLITIVDK